MAGGKKRESQQKEMSTDLSKFLYHASPAEFDFLNVVKVKAIAVYVNELEQRKLGPSGIIAKLNILCHAQNFLIER